MRHTPPLSSLGSPDPHETPAGPQGAPRVNNRLSVLPSSSRENVRRSARRRRSFQSLATQTAPRDRRPPSPHRTLPCAVRGDRSAPARPRSRHTAARHLLALPDRSLPQPRPIVSTDMEVSSTKSITRIQNPGRGLDGMAMLERERGLGRSVNSGVWGVIQAKARLLAGPAEARGGDAGMALGLAGVRWTSAALVAAAARSHHLVADIACGRAQSGCREHPASSSRPATRRRLSPQSTRVTCVGGAPWAAPPTPMPA